MGVTSWALKALRVLKFEEVRPIDPQIIISDIKKHYQSERLVLVLGAGVSMNHGVPSWNTLLQELILESITSSLEGAKSADPGLIAEVISKVFSPSPLISARYLSTRYKKQYKQDSFAFTKAVRAALYKGLDPDLETDLIKEIRELCVAAGKLPNLDSVITYNYDDLLEYSIQKLGLKVPFRSIYATGMNPHSNELAIFHVHGFLPRSVDLDDSNQIALSEDMYHRQYKEAYAWSNLVQINKFKDANCLFIGVSFTDPNLRRLLEIARSQRGDNEIHHYCFRKKYDIAEVKHEILGIAGKENAMQELTPEALDESASTLIRIMQGYETSDFESFGVRAIWIDEYSEIPEFLSQIREQDPYL